MADDIKIEIDTKDLAKDFEKLKKVSETACMQAARAIGGEAAGFAKENCPVDTGLLRNSIVFAISGGEASQSSYRADVGDGHGEYSGTMPKDKACKLKICKL